MIAATATRTKLTPPELAAQWGLDVHKVLAWIKSGELRAIDAAQKKGGRHRFLIGLDDIAEFEARRTVQTPAPRAPRKRKPPDIEIIKYF